MRSGIPTTKLALAIAVGTAVMAVLSGPASIVDPIVGLQDAGAAESASRDVVSLNGKIGSYRWEVAIHRSVVAGTAEACLSAALGSADSPTGMSTLCRKSEPTPLVVGNSSGNGPQQASVVGVMTTARASSLAVDIRGRRLRTIPVHVASGHIAKELGLGEFGYAAVAFTGPGCLHRLVAHDSGGRRIGRPIWGC
jgi:hypothetical protein